MKTLESLLSDPLAIIIGSTVLCILYFAYLTIKNKSDIP